MSRLCEVRVQKAAIELRGGDLVQLHLTAQGTRTRGRADALSGLDRWSSYSTRKMCGTMDGPGMVTTEARGSGAFVLEEWTGHLFSSSV